MYINSIYRGLSYSDSVTKGRRHLQHGTVLLSNTPGNEREPWHDSLLLEFIFPSRAELQYFNASISLLPYLLCLLCLHDGPPALGRWLHYFDLLLRMSWNFSLKDRGARHADKVQNVAQQTL